MWVTRVFILINAHFHPFYIDIIEIGRTAKVYCEMAQRLEPTVSDVNLALIDVGMLNKNDYVIINWLIML